MADVALINAPTTAAMTQELREQFRSRVAAAELVVLTERFVTLDDYREAFGRLTTARLALEDFETIVGKYERK